MAGFVSGANGNDDVFDSGPDDRQRTGYIGDDPINGPDNSPAGSGNSAYNPTGNGYQVANRYMVAGTSVADQDVDRYRNLGAQPQAAVQLNQGQADQSRELQMGALGMMGQAARGNAPSQAAEAGTMNADAALRGQLAGLSGARGPGGGVRGIGAGIANNVGAQTGAGLSMGSLAGQAMNARAGEMAHAQQGYAGATQAARGQDIGAATTNAQLTAQQRAIDQARQQQYERLAWNTRRTTMQGEDDYRAEHDRQANARRLARDAQNAQDWNNVKDDASIGLSAFGLLSDERTKRRVVPMGSLGHLMKGGHNGG